MVNWKEVSKFLSGAEFVGSFANGILYLNDISVPLFGYTITPKLFGLRAIVNFALFLILFYYGYLKK